LLSIMASETERPKLEIVHKQLDASESTNPFANLDALRNPQDYEEFMNGEAVTGFAVRTLKEGLHLRVRPGAEYSLLGQYTVTTKKAGVYFVYPQFREALGPMPRRCNLHVAVDGHGEYFLLLIKQQNPGKDENEWFRTARVVAAAATEGWIRVTKLKGDGGWGYVSLIHQIFDPRWPDKSLSDLLNAAFPDHVVNTLSHDLIKEYEERGS
jgi:hypothetical protein